MTTVIFSQILGLIRQRLLVSIFGASNTLGIYLAATRIPDFLFQIIIAGALSSAFIPVFSEFLEKNKVSQAHELGSRLIILGFLIFSIISIFLFIFADFFSGLIAPGFSSVQITLMGQLIRIIIFSELLFLLGSFLSVILQSYNHFFIPGIATAFYNLGMIIGIIFLSPVVGIFSAAYGSLLGAFIFILVQLPMSKKIGFSFKPSFNFKTEGIREVLHLMVPRTLTIAVFQFGTMITLTLVSFLPSPGRNYVILDYAQTLAFAPVILFGQTIAQAAFPVLSREKERLEEFKTTFITSFNQMLYLVLPVSVLILVLRIPVVRLVFGAGQFDWEATVLTGRTLAFFSFAIFAQALIYLVSRAFYALHDTKTPLIISTITTLIMVMMSFLFVFYYKLGIESIALASSISGVLSVIVLMIFLDRKTKGFSKSLLILTIFKIFISTLFTGVALYIPIKLLDQLVFDTTKTVNLLFLTGISSFIGLSLYLFLTWLFNVKEAMTFILLFKKIGNWRDILEEREETIDTTRIKP